MELVPKHVQRHKYPEVTASFGTRGVSLRPPWRCCACWPKWLRSATRDSGDEAAATDWAAATRSMHSAAPSTRMRLGRARAASMAVGTLTGRPWCLLSGRDDVVDGQRHGPNGGDIVALDEVSFPANAISAALRAARDAPCMTGGVTCRHPPCTQQRETTLFCFSAAAEGCSAVPNFPTLPGHVSTTFHPTVSAAQLEELHQEQQGG